MLWIMVLNRSAIDWLQGKAEQGTIHLRAFHSGNHVFIEIEEDGRGIYREKVFKTALKNGLVTAEQAAKLSDHGSIQLAVRIWF